jgi:Ca-activated chloride channel family protein
LYAGEPIVLTACSSAPVAGTLQLHGRVGGRAWTQSLALDSAAPGLGIDKLWARAKIGAVEDWRYRGAVQSDIDAEVLRVALQHHLVSRLTSLVAVDVTPSRPADEELVTAQLSTNLPHGWDFGKVRSDSEPQLVAALDPALLAKLAASKDPAGAAADSKLTLPQTDAGTDAQLLFGALLLAAGWALTRLRGSAPRPC